jgi:hypothetical protein
MTSVYSRTRLYQGSQIQFEIGFGFGFGNERSRGKLGEMCVNVVCVCIKERFGDGMSEAKVESMMHHMGQQFIEQCQMWNIRHLQENFESVISDLKWCHANPGESLPVDESHHEPMHVESLLQSLARLSDARPLDLG